MLKATEQDIRSFSQAGKTMIELFTDLRFRMKNTVSHSAFDIPVAILFGIEIRRIRRQPLDVNVRVLRQKSLDHLRPVHRRAIPNQNDGALNPPAKMFEPDNQFFGIDRTVEMPFVDLACDGQSHHRRGFPAIAAMPFEQRGPAHRRPGAGHGFGVRQAKFVFKNDLSADPLRLFLSWASPSAARPGSALHRAPTPAFPAFAHSIPGHAVAG